MKTNLIFKNEAVISEFYDRIESASEQHDVLKSKEFRDKLEKAKTDYYNEIGETMRSKINEVNSIGSYNIKDNFKIMMKFECKEVIVYEDLDDHKKLFISTLKDCLSLNDKSDILKLYYLSKGEVLQMAKTSDFFKDLVPILKTYHKICSYVFDTYQYMKIKSIKLNEPLSNGVTEIHFKEKKDCPMKLKKINALKSQIVFDYLLSPEEKEKQIKEAESLFMLLNYFKS